MSYYFLWDTIRAGKALFEVRTKIYVALVILIFCLAIGVPVPVSFMSSCAWLIFFGGANGAGYPATQLLPYGFTQMNSVSLIAIAMFILAGGIMERGRIAEKLIDMVDVFVGHIRGGLGIRRRHPLRRVRLHLRSRLRDALLHRRHHVPAPQAGRIPNGPRLRAYGQRLAARTPHPAERDAHHLRLDKRHLRPLLLPFDGRTGLRHDSPPQHHQRLDAPQQQGSLRRSQAHRQGAHGHVHEARTSSRFRRSSCPSWSSAESTAAS